MHYNIYYIVINVKQLISDLLSR